MPEAALWTGLDRLIDSAPSLEDLRAHRLHLLAADRWRRTERDAPDFLAIEELAAIQRLWATRLLLRTAREAYDGRIAVLKGVATAGYYPDPALRPSTDVDILVDDPELAQRALVSAGFEPVGRFEDNYYAGLHHLRPLRMPGDFPVVVEIHRRPNWVDWLDPPGREELLSSAVEGIEGAPGVLTLDPRHHALLIAAHSWGESPLRRILDLVDVTAVSADCDPRELKAQAREWGLARVWDATTSAGQALIFGRGRPWSLRIWARDLAAVRDRTVFENHLRRWLGPFWALPPHRAAAATLVALTREVTPAPNETWGNRMRRAREAVLHPTRRSAHHDRVIGPEGIQPRHKRR